MPDANNSAPKLIGYVLLPKDPEFPDLMFWPVDGDSLQLVPIQQIPPAILPDAVAFARNLNSILIGVLVDIKDTP